MKNKCGCNKYSCNTCNSHKKGYNIHYPIQYHECTCVGKCTCDVKSKSLPELPNVDNIQPNDLLYLFDTSKKIGTKIDIASLLVYFNGNSSLASEINIDNCLFIDQISPKGDDATAQVGNPHKPYKTYGAALGVSVAGQTICFLSDYTAVASERILLKDGVDLMGFGRIVQLNWISINTNGATIWDNNIAVNCKITNIKTYRQGGGSNRWGAYFQNPGTIIYGNNFYAYSVAGSGLVNYGEIYNCFGESTFDDGIQNEGKAYNCIAKTSGDDAFVNHGYAENCSGYSTSFYGFSNYSDTIGAKAIAINCIGYSTANIGFINAGIYGKAVNCYGFSSAVTGLQNTDGLIIDCIGESSFTTGKGMYNLNGYAKGCKGYSLLGIGFENGGGVKGNAIDCYGETEGIGITGFLNLNFIDGAINCIGKSITGRGFDNKSKARGCKGFSGSFYGFENNSIATNCEGYSDTGFGLFATVNSEMINGHYETAFNNVNGHATRIQNNCLMQGVTTKCINNLAYGISAAAAINARITGCSGKALDPNITNTLVAVEDARGNYFDINL